MATSRLAPLILSAIVLCGVVNGKKEILKDEIDRMFGSLKNEFSGLKQTCMTALPKLLDTEVSTFSACTKLEAIKTAVVAGCTQPTYDKLKKFVCDLITAAEDRRDKRVANITTVMNGVSQTCKTKIPATEYKDWTAIDTLCNKIQNTETAAIKTSCPDDEYDKVESVVCGATFLVIGFVAIAFSFMAHAFNVL